MLGFGELGESPVVSGVPVNDIERRTAEYYRDKAAEIRLAARRTTSPEVARELLELAYLFDRMAAYVERRGVARPLAFLKKVTLGDKKVTLGDLSNGPSHRRSLDGFPGLGGVAGHSPWRRGPVARHSYSRERQYGFADQFRSKEKVWRCYGRTNAKSAILPTNCRDSHWSLCHSFTHQVRKSERAIVCSCMGNRVKLNLLPIRLKVLTTGW